MKAVIVGLTIRPQDATAWWRKLLWNWGTAACGMEVELTLGTPDGKWHRGGRVVRIHEVDR